MYFEFFHQAPEFFVFFYTTKTFPLKLLHKISPLESLDRLQMHIYNRFDWETSQTQFSEQMKHTTQENLEFPGYKKKQNAGHKVLVWGEENHHAQNADFEVHIIYSRAYLPP